jgi:hypothetical protein
MPLVAGDSENKDEMLESVVTCHTPQPSNQTSTPFPTLPACPPVFVSEESINRDVLDQFNI